MSDELGSVQEAIEDSFLRLDTVVAFSNITFFAQEFEYPYTDQDGDTHVSFWAFTNLAYDALTR